MANLANNSIWPDVEARLVDLVETHNSTIVFANSRRLAERLTARLNEIHAERSGEESMATANPKVAGGAPAHLLGSGQTYGAPTLLARAHHGSVSKEQRAIVEERPQIRAAEGGGGDLEPRTGHRHGRSRPGDPGGGAAVGGQRPAAHRARRTPGRRDLARRAFPEAPHRLDQLRGVCAAHAHRPDRDDAGAHESARHPGPAHRGRGRVGAVGRRPLVRHGAAQCAVCDAAAQRIRGHPGSAVRQVPVRPSSPS